MPASPPVRPSFSWSHHHGPGGPKKAVLHAASPRPVQAMMARMSANRVFPAPTNALVRRVAMELGSKRRSKPGFRDFTKAMLMWARFRLGVKTERSVISWLELTLLDFRDDCRKREREIVRGHLEVEAEKFFDRAAKAILSAVENGKDLTRDNLRGYKTFLISLPDGFSSRIGFVTMDPATDVRPLPSVVCIETESRYKRRLKRGANRRRREFRNQPNMRYH